MISDVNEWQRFPDQGTIIMKAIDNGVDLFNAFDFLDSSGNIMVIFSDGQDNNVQIGKMSLDQVLKKAVDNKVPVYMIRTAYARGLFDVVPDQVWKKAIDATGGKFYPAASQETIMQAIKEIDAAATGRVDVREYTVKQPRYMRFALAAVMLWTLALGAADDVDECSGRSHESDQTWRISMRRVCFHNHRYCSFWSSSASRSWPGGSSGGWPSRRKTWPCSTSSIRKPNTPRSKRNRGLPLVSERPLQGNSPPPRDAAVLAGRLRRSRRGGAHGERRREDADAIDPEMRVLAANALYRVAQRGPQDRADAAQEPRCRDPRVQRSAARRRLRPDVAFNYELAVRMRAGSRRRQA